MNTTLRTAIALAFTACLAAPAAYAATMSKADYSAAKTRIGATFKADKAACDGMSGNAKDICREEAKATDKVALAELEYSYTGKPADQMKLRTVKADTAYAVAKEKCDDQAGNAKAVCVTEAKAVKTKALADVKLGEKVGEARTDAAQTKRDADYKVLAEKCDALAGEAKAGCISAAKAQTGKT
jgi:hypothetical protein